MEAAGSPETLVRATSVLYDRNLVFILLLQPLKTSISDLFGFTINSETIHVLDIFEDFLHGSDYHKALTRRNTEQGGKTREHIDYWS